MNVSQLKFLDRLLRTCVRRLPRKRPKQLLTAPASILVIKLSAMGDALCLMPSVRMLSQVFPEATIDWLTTHRSQQGVFSRISFLNAIHLLPVNPIGLLWFLVRFVPKLRSYELIIDYDQYYQISEIFSYLGRTSAGFHAPLKGKTFAIQETYQAFRNEKLQFRALTEKVITHWRREIPEYVALLPELLQGFSPSSQLQKAAKALRSTGKPVLILYPGSSGNASFRRWELSNYLCLIDEYHEKYVIIIAGGPDEKEIKSIFEYKNDNVINWIDKWSLSDWSWIFKNIASLFVGNDAGLLHVADLQGLVSISIFGPNLYEKWGSLNPSSMGIEINVECRPCIKQHLGDVPQKCHRGDLACLQQIEVIQVVSAINSTLSNAN
jgi:ADP-heptose:LPS heptosyltransferase